MDMDGTHRARPRIGVAWIGAAPSSDARYMDSVREAGGEPVPLPAGEDSWVMDLATIQGLLLTGGGDVDPTLYDQTNEGLSEHVIPERDRLEWQALRLCIDRGLPVFGICRGFQVINAFMGGSLIQDIASQTNSELPHSSDPTGRGRPSRYHTIQVLPDTMLASLLGQAGEFHVNSRHHQGLGEEEVAPGLRVTALAPDGVVEGLEAEDGRFLVAVQCHPERPEEVPPEMARLFEALVEQARTADR